MSSLTVLIFGSSHRHGYSQTSAFTYRLHIFSSGNFNAPRMIRTPFIESLQEQAKRSMLHKHYIFNSQGSNEEGLLPLCYRTLFGSHISMARHRENHTKFYSFLR